MKCRSLWALAPLLVAIIVAAGTTASAQSVLRVARGLASNDISVLVNRAIVVESSQPFTELSVAQPEIADVQPLSANSIYVLGRQRGATTLTLLDEDGKLITNVTIRVAPDLAQLKERLKTLLPTETIEVRTAGSGLVLSGEVSGKAKIDRAMSLARAYAGQNVTNMMSVGGTQQVSLKVRIAEIERSAGKDLGFSIGALSSTERAAPVIITGENVRPAGNLPVPQEGALGTGSPDLGAGVVETFAAAGGFLGAFSALFSIADNTILDLRIDALEAKGFARMLAEPTIVALSGQEAEFLAGGEVPVPAVDGEGNVEVDFRPIGVNVIFQPRVLDDDLINLAVSAEVSTINPNNSIVSGGLDVPGFDVRRATTMIELRDGQSFAIAGLYQEDFEDTINQVPWLGDVPVLGTLFRSTNFQKGESELVIIVTVNLVIPVDSEDQLRLPTDRIPVPNEAELFLLGNTVSGGASAGVFASQDFDGAYGYIVE